MSSSDVYKVVLVGNAGVGKTQMLGYFTRPATGPYVPTSSKPTIGVEFGTKLVEAPDGASIKAQIWDTAGQERYRAITSAHYRRAAGALVVYDVSNIKSFEDAKATWLKELRESADEESGIHDCIMLVGNKVDLEQQAEDKSGFVSRDEHEAFCRKEGLMSMRTSAITGENVDKAFKQLIIKTYDKARELASNGAGRANRGVKMSAEKKKGGCC
jgi:Ras-related protein Rab-11A